LQYSRFFLAVFSLQPLYLSSYFQWLILNSYLLSPESRPLPSARCLQSLLFSPIEDRILEIVHLILDLVHIEAVLYIIGGMAELRKTFAERFCQIGQFFGPIIIRATTRITINSGIPMPNITSPLFQGI